MKLIIRQFITIILLLLTNSSFSQQKGEIIISGKITTDNNVIIRGAQIALIPIGVESYTDDNGEFKISLCQSDDTAEYLSVYHPSFYFYIEPLREKYKDHLLSDLNISLNNNNKQEIDEELNKKTKLRTKPDSVSIELKIQNNLDNSYIRVADLSTNNPFSLSNGSLSFIIPRHAFKNLNDSVYCAVYLPNLETDVICVGKNELRVDNPNHTIVMNDLKPINYKHYQSEGDALRDTINSLFNAISEYEKKLRTNNTFPVDLDLAGSNLLGTIQSLLESINDSHESMFSYLSEEAVKLENRRNQIIRISENLQFEYYVSFP